jgi:hypothetical protein
MGLHLFLILFVFSLILYPLLRGLRDGPGQTILNRLGDFLALPGVVYGLAVPVAWLMVTLNPRDFIGVRDFGGWPLPIYMLFFLYGFFVISHDGLQKHPAIALGFAFGRCAVSSRGRVCGQVKATLLRFSALPASLWPIRRGFVC